MQTNKTEGQLYRAISPFQRNHSLVQVKLNENL